MIKAVIFDWGGVLIDDLIPKITAYCAEYLELPEEEFGRVLENVRLEFSRGVTSEDEFWSKVCGEFGIPKPDIDSLWGEAFRRYYLEKEEVFSLASSLHRSGYKIGFLSNTEVPAVEYFREREYKIFDVTVFSCLEGTVKPERKVYEIALDRLEVKPEEAVFIDDKRRNVEGAERVGIKGILFKNSDQLKKELASFSVKVD